MIEKESRNNSVGNRKGNKSGLFLRGVEMDEELFVEWAVGVDGG